MFRKAQAAMEFLMTYGWAILVVLVVIGALATFGVLNPANLLPEKCAFSVALTCNDHQVSASSITLVLLNGGGRDMLVRDISASSDALGSGSAGEGCSMTVSDLTLRNGQQTTFTLNQAEQVGACTFRDVGKDKNKYNITVFYSWMDSQSIIHPLAGELTSKSP